MQKGPFVVGSSVQVAPLNAATLQPTGQTFTTQTSNDKGEFDVVFKADGPVAVEGSGFYYNEITGPLSGAELTLRAFFVPNGTGAQEAFLNLVTHLTTERIKALVTGGAAFEVAVAQAESELFNGLDLSRDGYAPGVSGIRMSALGGDTDDNAYLLLMSATLLQTADTRPAGSLEAKLQELLNQMAIDLADGTRSPSLRDELAAALLAVDLAFVETQLAARFAQIGSAQPVPDMAKVADQDKDGLANASDNCPKLANANQANGDGDRYGDACDRCPATGCDGLCIPGAAGAADTCFATCTGDAGFVCSNEIDACGGGGATGNERCVAAGGLDEPCLADGGCDTAALVCKSVSSPSVPWNRECVTGQPIGQPCDGTYPCVAAGFCANNDGVCGVGVTCCQARQPVGGACDGDPGRCQVGLNCKHTSFAPCPNALTYCCVEAGGDGEARSYPDNSCDSAGYACFGGRCVPAGGSGQPCHPGALCDLANLACIDGLCRASLGACGIGGSCPSGAACRQSLCLETGGAYQACDTGGACDALDLVCQSTWSAPSGACLMDYVTCCQPAGGPGEYCRADGSCTDDNVCGYAGCPLAMPSCCLAP